VTSHPSSSSPSSGFEIYPDGNAWRWRFLDEQGRETMTSANSFASSELAAMNIGHMQATVDEARVRVIKPSGTGWPDVKVDGPETRWRPIAPDGTMGQQPEPESPDDPDEGETGPTEGQLCAEPECVDRVPHFQHAQDPS